MIYLYLFLAMFSTSSLANTLYCQWDFLPQQEKAHRYITHDLYMGNIVEAYEFHANNMNQIFKVKIHNPQTQNTRWAMYKPRIPGDGGGYHRVTMEYVGYKINRWLGMDLIPPVAYRKNVNMNGTHYPEGGALIYFVDDAHSLQAVDRKIWDSSNKDFQKIDQELFYSDTQILDVVLQNHDRHKDNFLRAKHWTDGEYRPMLIDHGAVLKNQTNAITMTPESGAIEVVRKRTLDNLTTLNHAKLRGEFHEFLSDQEIDYILERRDSILHYFHNKIESRGYDSVVIDR